MLKSKTINFKTLIKSRLYHLYPKCKVIKFCNIVEDIITEEDMSYLLTSVINLIKSNVRKTVERKYEKQIQYYKNLLDLNLNKLKKLSSK